jgi:DNA-binding winged helix-turn-helix (wHTH) protein
MADPAGYSPPTAHRRYKAGDVEIRPDKNSVVVSGEERYLRQQAMQVLIYLLQRPDQVVPTEVLNRELWNDLALTDAALVHQCVAEISKALGDRPRRPRFVRTVAKEGYCFMGPVSEFLESGVTAEPKRPVPFWRRWRQ